MIGGFTLQVDEADEQELVFRDSVVEQGCISAERSFVQNSR